MKEEKTRGYATRVVSCRRSCVARMVVTHVYDQRSWKVCFPLSPFTPYHAVTVKAREIVLNTTLEEIKSCSYNYNFNGISYEQSVT